MKKSTGTIPVTISCCGEIQKMTIGPDPSGRSIELEDKVDKRDEGYHSMSLVQEPNGDLVREFVEYFSPDRGRPKYEEEFVGGYCRIWNSMLKKKGISQKEFTRLWDGTRKEIDKAEDGELSYLAEDEELLEDIPF